ncbi:MAG: hypothetical protein Q8L71_13080 [Thiobacillus sp.]|nr:hypothetical protein [Thiobacillus sp.]
MRLYPLIHQTDFDARWFSALNFKRGVLLGLAAIGRLHQASHELSAFLRKATLHGRPKAAKKAEEVEAAAWSAGTP